MCGIAGFWATGWDSVADGRVSVQRMADTLSYRGPDDCGVWIDEAQGLALAHRRLSIVDLSPHGHQPMVSACGRYVICLNGEIYNFPDIRRELEQADSQKPVWRGHSDTEVALEAIVRWGIIAALQRFEGMFAFALWDRAQRRLHLARDRFGEKPLFYGWLGSTLVFASELKALRAHPEWRGTVDRSVLALYFRHGYIPAPYSIHEGIWKLPPGTTLTLFHPGQVSEPNAYWSLRETAMHGAAQPFDGDNREAAERLDGLLKRSVGRQMLADVPVGAFLSGGIDSSLVVALMQAQSSIPVKTFTIGFTEPRYDESGYARRVASHLGTDHAELVVTPRQAMSVIPELPTIYDEPFGDSSQIPTLLVCHLARQHVIVTLSGDGGDELFGGYNHYQWGRTLWRAFGWMPTVLRQVVGGIVGLGACGSERTAKLAEVLALGSASALYWGLTSHWREAGLVLGSGTLDRVLVERPDAWPPLGGFVQRMMYLDSMCFLPDDILVKLDRASMHFSLESRAPLLNHAVAEFAWSLPLHMKIRHGTSKWLLRQVLNRYVPRPLVERPKMGFGVPVGEWLRGPLRGWGESLLNENQLRRQGYLNPELVRAKWAEHQSGQRDHLHKLWDVLMFQSWLQRQ